MWTWEWIGKKENRTGTLKLCWAPPKSNDPAGVLQHGYTFGGPEETLYIPLNSFEEAMRLVDLITKIVEFEKEDFASKVLNRAYASGTSCLRGRPC